MIGALRKLDWSRCSVSLRINGLDSHYCYRDLVDVVEQAGDRLDSIMIPKAGGAGGHPAGRDPAEPDRGREAAMHASDRDLRTDRDRARGWSTARRLRALAPSGWRRWCSASLTMRLRSRATRPRSAAPIRITRCSPIPSRTPTAASASCTLGRPWHYALSRIAVVCRAYGLRPIDGPFGDFTDPEGYLASARRAAVLGYEGKWAIHPSQIELANEAFTPSASGSSRRRTGSSRRCRRRRGHGRGAVSLDGRLIDAASIRMAENLLATVEQIEARDAGAAKLDQPTARQ